MNPTNHEYQTKVCVQENPIHPSLLLIQINLTVWEAMSADGRTRTVNALLSALRQHNAEAETRVHPVIVPPTRPKPPAHP